MFTERIHILGAGGHAKVVIDALRTASGDKDIEFKVFDDNPDLSGRILAGVVIQPNVPLALGDTFHVAIGSNSVRSRLFRQLTEAGAEPITIIHPTSSVASSSSLGRGIFIAALSILSADSIVGEGVIVNHGAVIDHDCMLGKFCHIAPNATLGGGVKIGERTLVGAGAIVLPGLRVANDVTIGAGAVVTKSIEEAGTFIGLPAKEVKKC